MQRRQQRSLKRSTEETWKILENKKEKKGPSGEENYQEGLQQENYLDGQKYDEEYWARLGGDRKEEEQGGKEQWKQ